MAIPPSANSTTSVLQCGRRTPIMVSRRDIESARLSMLATRKALENHETIKGVASSCEHMRLGRAFAKATQAYPKLSANQRCTGLWQSITYSRHFVIVHDCMAICIRSLKRFESKSWNLTPLWIPSNRWPATCSWFGHKLALVGLAPFLALKAELSIAPLRASSTS
jgi:hypothetical protein